MGEEFWIDRYDDVCIISYEGNSKRFGIPSRTSEECSRHPYRSAPWE
jgi:hypothetical protein